jgi:hypothetical protein
VEPEQNMHGLDKGAGPGAWEEARKMRVVMRNLDVVAP